MGFTKNLAKGFVRSAVNQVGRDAGKVVSNQLYGDAHSTPHRGVGSTYTVPNGIPVNNDLGLDFDEQRIIPCEPTSTGTAWCYVLIACIFNLLGGIVLIYNGNKKLKNRHLVKADEYTNQATYAPDRRYKTNERYEGHMVFRRKILVEASPEDVEQNEAVGKIYLYSGIAIVVLYFIALFIVNAQSH